jgi:hypothetical protein
MKKFLVLATLAFALIAGTATVMIPHHQKIEPLGSPWVRYFEVGRYLSTPNFHVARASAVMRL